MRDYPAMADHSDHVEPVPRRVRAVLAGRTVVDSVRALYVWDRPHYPQFHIPVTDVTAGVLVDEGEAQTLPRGTARRHGLQVGAVHRPGVALVYGAGADPAVAGTVRFEWAALDAWYEEDEEVFVHPRNPYTRVDALRSSRAVRVALAGVVLAESSSTVMVFETGLPTRYYFERTAVDFSRLVASDTVSACPYKGRTSGYWSARIGAHSAATAADMAADTATDIATDIAWAYDFPTRQLLPIAGLVAFYNEALDITVDGVPLERPSTHLRGEHRAADQAGS